MKKSFRNILLAVGLTLSAHGANATPIMSFIIDGDTFSQPFRITNGSDAGESILRFFINLSTAGSSDLCFDTISGGGCNTSAGVPFTPLSGASVASSGVVDGGSTLDIFFNSFNAGSTFSFDIDVDQPTSPTVRGNQMIGATAFADFSDGTRLFGVFESISGNGDASAFNATGTTPTPAVPLPASAFFLIAGLGGLAAFKGRTKQ